MHMCVHINYIVYIFSMNFIYCIYMLVANIPLCRLNYICKLYYMKRYILAVMLSTGDNCLIYEYMNM